ncbi:MAG TPA: 2-dehydropantoate 2-reductase N-terminal domain-containing protein, partial [Dermatophilaceae bacterium]|nr:2-dehydropantoate 2-reductase N-terminal domain-containing protein [Dermatophilaceae bacterium]
MSGLMSDRAVRREISSVAIVGAGAMGAMYAVHVAEAGFDVSLVATGERARRVARGGIRGHGRHRAFPMTHPTPATQP